MPTMLDALDISFFSTGFESNIWRSDSMLYCYETSNEVSSFFKSGDTLFEAFD